MFKENLKSDMKGLWCETALRCLLTFLVTSGQYHCSLQESYQGLGLKNYA